MSNTPPTPTHEKLSEEWMSVAAEQHADDMEIRGCEAVIVELESFQQTIAADSAVSKRQALALEGMSPGLLPETAPTNSFTEMPSPTNVHVTTEAIGKAIVSTLGDIIKKVLEAIGKVLSWIKDKLTALFGRSEQTEETAKRTEAVSEATEEVSEALQKSGGDQARDARTEHEKRVAELNEKFAEDIDEFHNDFLEEIVRGGPVYGALAEFGQVVVPFMKGTLEKAKLYLDVIKGIQRPLSPADEEQFYQAVSSELANSDTTLSGFRKQAERAFPELKEASNAQYLDKLNSRVYELYSSKRSRPPGIVEIERSSLMADLVKDGERVQALTLDTQQVLKSATINPNAEITVGAETQRLIQSLGRVVTAEHRGIQGFFLSVERAYYLRSDYQRLVWDRARAAYKSVKQAADEVDDETLQETRRKVDVTLKRRLEK